MDRVRLPLFLLRIGVFIVMLMWMWISAMFLLAGAQINAVLDERSAAPEKAQTTGVAQTRAPPPRAPASDPLGSRSLS